MVDGPLEIQKTKEHQKSLRFAPFLDFFVCSSCQPHQPLPKFLGVGMAVLFLTVILTDPNLQLIDAEPWLKKG